MKPELGQGKLGAAIFGIQAGTEQEFSKRIFAEFERLLKENKGSLISMSKYFQ